MAFRFGPRLLIPALGGTLTALAGCGGLPAPQAAEFSPATEIVSRGEGPPDARPDGCYSRDTTPAVIETVTEQRLLRQAELDPDGEVIAPAIFEVDTRQQIVEEREDVWFETPCAAEDDAEFIAALQRALAVRGHYAGPVSGQMDMRTRRAVRAFQEPRGLNSGVLSLAAARELGLAVWDPVAAALGDPGAARPPSAADITGQ